MFREYRVKYKAMGWSSVGKDMVTVQSGSAAFNLLLINMYEMHIWDL